VPLLWKRLDWHVWIIGLYFRGVEEGRMLQPLTRSPVPSRDVAKYLGGFVSSSVLLGQSSRSLCGNSAFQVNPCRRLQVRLHIEEVADDGDSPARTSELSNDKLPCFAP